MTNTPTIPAVVRSVTVNATAAHAFRTFTEGFHSWGPSGYKIGSADLAEAVLEPRAGGRWYERDVDGSECDWGQVLAWEPPHRLLLAWQIDGAWQHDPDPEHASQIEVRFVADGPTRTVVSVEHRQIDRLAHASELFESIGGDGGWNTLLARFAAKVEAA
jgi:uncharacterized protein YndB with AHSA1/START domain